MGRVKQNNQFTKDLFTLCQKYLLKLFWSYLKLPASLTNFVLRICVFEFVILVAI